AGPVLPTSRFGAPMSVFTGGLGQSPAATQSGSPQIGRAACRDTVEFAVDACGVTLMVKFAEALTARPVGTGQVTVWPAIVQPAAVLMVRPAGTASVTVAAAVVAAVPVFVTVMT